MALALTVHSPPGETGSDPKLQGKGYRNLVLIEVNGVIFIIFLKPDLKPQLSVWSLHAVPFIISGDLALGTIKKTSLLIILQNKPRR